MTGNHCAACMAFFFLLILAGTVSADTQNTTPSPDQTPVIATTEPERIGGSAHIVTEPDGATVWVENIKVGTSDLTYYSERTGTFNVRIWKKGYENYTGTITIEEGKRTEFEALLKRVTIEITDTSTPVAIVTTRTTLQRSTMTLPTPWPVTPESPFDPAVTFIAAALGLVFYAIRRS